MAVLYGFNRWGFSDSIGLTSTVMEAVSDQPSLLPDPQAAAKQRVEAASDFLSFCDGIGRPAIIDGL